MNNPIDVVLVGRGRPEFLASTLTCLVLQSVPLRIHVVYHTDKGIDSYFLDQISKTASFENKEIIHYFRPESRSLASCRSEILKLCNSNLAFMVDNDEVFDRFLIENLLKSYENIIRYDSKCIHVGVSNIDVDNTRDYPDYNPQKIYSSVKEYREATGHTGECFQRYSEDTKVAYGATHGLWNIAFLSKAGVLDFWDKYPVGKRGYDINGSKVASDKGYTFYMGKNSLSWHLWTLDSDKGYFIPQGEFESVKLKKGVKFL